MDLHSCSAQTGERNKERKLAFGVAVDAAVAGAWRCFCCYWYRVVGTCESEHTTYHHLVPQATSRSHQCTAQGMNSIP